MRAKGLVIGLAAAIVICLGIVSSPIVRADPGGGSNGSTQGATGSGTGCWLVNPETGEIEWSSNC